MTYRYRDGFDYIGEDCAWSVLYGKQCRVNFAKWRLLEEQLSTELTEDEFCFLCRYISRSKDKSAAVGAVNIFNLKDLLMKYRAWRDESSSLF